MLTDATGKRKTGLEVLQSGQAVPIVTGVPTGRSLACRPPAAAGMAARPGDNLRLPPAMLASLAGFFRTDARVHHTVTGLPQSGCSHRAHRRRFTRTVAGKNSQE